MKKHGPRFFIVLILSMIITLLISNKNELPIILWLSGGILAIFAAILNYLSCKDQTKFTASIFIIIGTIIYAVDLFGFKVEFIKMHWIGLEIIIFALIMLSTPIKCSYKHNGYI